MSEPAIDPRSFELAEQRKAALLALATNSHFIDLWVNGYMVGDIDNKLQQLSTCHIDDLPVARQRWLDAVQARDSLLAEIRTITHPSQVAEL